MTLFRCIPNNITDTKKDPVTNENVFSHNELSTYKTDESFKLLEYSILKQSQISGAENILEILGDGLKGNVYAFPF